MNTKQKTNLPSIITGAIAGILIVLSTFLPIVHMSLIFVDVNYTVFKYETIGAIILMVLAVLIVLFPILRLGQVNIGIAVLVLGVFIFLMWKMYNPMVEDVSFDELYKFLAQAARVGAGFFCGVLGFILTLVSGVCAVVGKKEVH